MARRMSPTQYRSKLRQAQAKRKQAIDKVNREIRAYNQKVKTTVNRYNQEVSRYNAKVRTHNTRVRSNRERLKRELQKLAQASTQKRYATFGASVSSVQRSYARLEANAAASQYNDRFNEVLDLSEREAANSASVMNALLGSPEEPEEQEDALSSTIDHILLVISRDLLDRWHGALFSLSPRNPDSARHFCASSRELLIQIINSRAPDKAVLAEMPECQKTSDGRPTRRAKVRYFLWRSHLIDDALEEFAEQDINNVMQLFREFNDGTHGSPGHFSMLHLTAIKKRVEDAVAFLWQIIPDELRQTQ